MGDFGKVMEGFQRIQILPVLLVVYIDWPLCQVIYSNFTGRCNKQQSRSCKTPGLIESFDLFFKRCFAFGKNSYRIIFKKEYLFCAKP
jgi:hypothetical protein